jgi:hypothetical protein
VDGVGVIEGVAVLEGDIEIDGLVDGVREAVAVGV